MAKVWDKPVDVALRDYPFGPLLREWMRRGVGLPRKTGKPNWEDIPLGNAMAETQYLAGPPGGGSTIRSWKNGNGFPEGPVWNALREALTTHIDASVKAAWSDLLTAAWTRSAGLKSGAKRKAQYAPFAVNIAAMDMLLAEMERQTEEEIVLAETTALLRLHNQDPTILTAYQESVLARRESRYEDALSHLGPVISGNANRVAHARLRIEAQFLYLRQRGNVYMAMGKVDEAIADFAEARELVPFNKSDDSRQLTLTIWALVGRQLVEIDDFSDAEHYFRERLTELGESTVLGWSVLLNLAESYNEGRVVLDEMRDAKITPNVVTWSTLLNLAPDYPTGRVVLDEMRDAKVTPNVVTWSTLLSLADSYEQGRGVFDDMLKAAKTDPKITPDVVTWNTLLSVADSYEQGRGVFDDMLKAAKTDPKITPDVVTGVNLAKLVTSMAEADFVALTFLNLGQSSPYFFNTLVDRIYPLLSGEGLIGWCFGAVKGRGLGFPFRALESAIVGYRKTRRFDDALRIIFAFPYLPASAAYFRSEARSKHAEQYFTDRFNIGFEPHHASYALLKLYQARADRPNLLKWAKIALEQAGQPEKRVAELRALVAT